MKTAGIDKDFLLVESCATNTGENAIYSYKVLEDAGKHAHSMLLVIEPCMETSICLVSGAVAGQSRNYTSDITGRNIEKYCNEQQLFDNVVNIMDGDFEGILEYPKHGFQISQSITPELLNDLETLKHAGFIKHLLS